jgi:hypothetical protein
MAQLARSSLATYMAGLQAEGRIAFTRAEAIEAIGITPPAFLKAAARLQKRRMLLHPRQGFYIAVPPQFLSWGAPPPPWYIDALRLPCTPFETPSEIARMEDYVSRNWSNCVYEANHGCDEAYQGTLEKRLKPRRRLETVGGFGPPQPS